MKKVLLTFMCGGWLFTHGWSQCSGTPDFYDDYSTSTGWTAVDKTNHSPNVTIASGVVNYNNALDGREQRIVKALPFTLNDQVFVSECKIRVSGGNGALHTIMSFTENNNDTWYIQSGLLAECSAFSGVETNQDALFCTLTQIYGVTSPGCCPQSSDWGVIVGYKDGTVANSFISTGIPLANANTDYYVRMQRTSSNTGLISVFSDAAMTVHVTGSPQCFNLPATVSNLKYVQHGVVTGGSCNRALTAQIDDLKVYNGVLPCPAALNPVITSNNVLCAMNGITVDGSASTSAPTTPINAHQWLINRCDASGNYVSGSDWASAVGSGAPGVFSFPTISLGGPNVPCGEYYRITLQLSSCGNPNASTSKIIYLECPITDLQVPNNACYGAPTDLTANQAYYGHHMPTYTYTWNTLYPTTTTLASNTTQNPFTVYPTVPTQYQVIATSQAGCVSQATAWVYPTGGFYKNISTGWDNANVMLNPPGNLDDEWTVPNFSWASAYCVYPVTAGSSPHWVVPSSQGGWITGDADGSGTYANCYLVANAPAFDYQYQVNLPYTNSNYMLVINKFAADDDGEIYINGTSIFTLTPIGSSNNYKIGTTSIMNIPLSPGPNTILVKTANTNYCHTGMYMDAYIYGVCEAQRSTPVDESEVVQQEEMEHRFSLSPNPTTGKVLLSFENGKEELVPGTIIVYNASGIAVKTVDEAQLTDRFELNLEGLARGMYVVEVQTNYGRESRRIVLE